MENRIIFDYCLKSNMDRFIDTGAGTYEKAVDSLKSNMDRFIE